MSWACGCGWEGEPDGVIRRVEKDRPIVACPGCRRGGLVIARPRLLFLQSTCRATAEPAWRGTEYRQSRAPFADALAVYTDGSSTGSYSAVVVRSGEILKATSRHPEPARSRNVAAEVMAVALGLSFCPRASTALVVSDYLGTGLWLQGRQRIRCEATWLRLRALLDVMRRRDLKVGFVHHRGHQGDESQFTLFNNIADRLCSTTARRAVVGEPE